MNVGYIVVWVLLLDGKKVNSLLPFEYTSPETCNRDEVGRRENVDNKSDFYTVGILLYCILTGHLPRNLNMKDAHLIHSLHFDALWDENDSKLLSDLRYGIFRSFHEELYLGEIEDNHLKKVIEKATEKAPNSRYQSTTDFVNDLEGRDNSSNKDMKIDKKVSLSWYKRIFSSFSFNKHGRANIYCTVLLLFLCSKSISQTHMRIHHKGGGHSDVAIEQIDSITFVDGSDLPVEEEKLVGSWLWGDAEAGYYELLTFNDDKTYTGYDNYFTYGSDTMTYGWYMQMGSMLTLQSNGFGYNRRYNWFVLGLTRNALDVVTKMGRFVYYRLQPEVLHLQVGGEPLAYENGDSFVFADGVIVSIVDGKLKGMAKGATYVQKYIAETDCVVAYKVVVE